MDIMHVPAPRGQEHDTDTPTLRRLKAAVERWATQEPAVHLAVRSDTRGKKWLLDQCCRVIVLSDLLDDEDQTAAALEESLDALAEYDRAGVAR